MEDRAALLAALRLQLDFGADEALDDAPAGLRGTAAIAAAPLAVPVWAPGPASGSAPGPALALAPGTATRPTPPGASEAAALAAAATTLDALRDAMRGFTGSTLHQTATELVFSDGVPGAPVMLVGDAPGADEDRQGLPFLGPAGRLLDQMLASIGVSRATNAYLTNILPWRPPGNRSPTEQELALFLPFLRRHVVLARPRLLVLLGGTAAKTVLGRRDSISRLRGKWSEVEFEPSEVLPVLVTLHPANLTPLAKREAWADWLMLHRRMNEG